MPSFWKSPLITRRDLYNSSVLSGCFILYTHLQGNLGCPVGTEDSSTISAKPNSVRACISLSSEARHFSKLYLYTGVDLQVQQLDQSLDRCWQEIHVSKVYLRFVTNSVNCFVHRVLPQLSSSSTSAINAVVSVFMFTAVFGLHYSLQSAVLLSLLLCGDAYA